MQTAAHVGEALRMTIPSPEQLAQLSRTEVTGAFLANLKTVRTEVAQPSEPHVGDDLAFALLNTEAPLEQRRECADRALASGTRTILNHLPETGNTNPARATERATAISTDFVAAIMESAANYPEPIDTRELRRTFLELLKPDRGPEERLVTAIALSDIVRPYVVDRLLELDVYDLPTLQTRLAAMQADVSLVRGFVASTKHSVEFATAGKTSLTEAEIANELFDIGPIFAQGAQLFTTAAARAKDADQATFLSGVGRAMQEGVAMPSAERLTELEQGLPAGLTLVAPLSSAKVAYVLETQADGQHYATKIKRPGIEQALDDNTRVFKVMSDMLISYVRTHAGEGALADQINTAEYSLPLLLKMMHDELHGELNFRHEIAMQKQAAALYAGHTGVHIAKIVDKYSDDRHITMDKLPSKRFEDVPADERYLKNLIVLFIRGWKGKLLHGDKHGGNIKAHAEIPGAIVAYDWGKTIELPSGFTANMGRFLIAVARHKPKAIAKAYVRIQSSEFEQADEAQATAVAEQAVQSVARRSKRSGQRKGIGPGTTALLSSFLAIMGRTQKSVLDARYMTTLRSTAALSTIFKTELQKPAYEGRKGRTMLGAILSAVKEVYFVRRKSQTVSDVTEDK
jgi:hypothetical protein